MIVTKLLKLTGPSSTKGVVASNALYQIIGKFLSMGITVFVTVLVSRLYGREGYGEFNLMQSWPALFFIIVDFGFNAVVIRDVKKDKSQLETYLANVIGLRLVISFLIILVALGVLSFFPYNRLLKIGIILNLCLVVTQALYASANIIFQKYLRYDLSTISYILGYGAILITALVLIHFKQNVMWVSFAYVVGGSITFLAQYFLLKKFFFIRARIRLQKEIYKPLLIQAVPLGLMFVFSQINFKSDAILMSVLPVPAFIKLSQTEAVGVYGLPYKIFEVALVLPTFFMNAVYPIFIQKLETGKEDFLLMFYKTIGFLFLLGFAGAAVGAGLSGYVINLLGGQEFLQSAGVLRLLLIGLPIFYISQPISWFIVSLGKQKYLPAVYLLGAVFNVTLNLITIPMYSFYASSVLTWLSELFIVILLVIFARKSWKTYVAR
ncbi:flippase [Candidatus Nomurabacteria bacterium]|uniref:Flippase n=1 Tax=candidate division WWE3 bacterium TaxID=2053526 RepID=A0A955E267_UNCKA|nr:flippase [candidate division WWE3 bacterium]MCB9824082.1 flippase [Candidatus Nomurabacteria bacterium]MCB9826947.1 flippase [Candidatus Nomurabacteria bacterium]MCB9828023.1 flippase [Candidatus Nomurabacteria bacterium]HXK52531.1 flippase [bacterium]